MNKDEKMENMTAEDGKTPDLVADNVEKMRELFPEIFADGQIDFEALKQVLGDYSHDTEEHYSFTWHGKSEARRIAQLPSQGTLRPCPEESVNWDTTQNIFIEGDNLEVLKLLQKSYHRKVKMIYIDPPYNTGEEFIYPDRFKDNLDTYLKYTGQVDDEGFKLSANSESDGRYHTNWLNMMYPRLKLARNLLRDDGVIFVSIDDHEVHNLRHLLDEVFGSENFVTSFIWEKRTNRENRKIVSTRHDFILCYCREAGVLKEALSQLPMSAEALERYKNPDNDPRGPWKSDPATAQGGHGTTTQFYSFTARNGRVHELPSGRCWLFTQAVMEQAAKEGRLWFGKTGNGVPRVKTYLHAKERGLTPETIIFAKEGGTNERAKVDLKKLFDGDSVFETPKPVSLLSHLLELGAADGIVLDFFAGSCPVAEAVYHSPKPIRFIAVQLPEPTPGNSGGRGSGSIAGKLGYETIADIAKERIRRAAENTKSTKEEIATDLGFKVFKLDSSNIQTWDADYATMDKDLFGAIDNIKTDRSQDDVLYELLLKYGLDLAIPVETRTIHGKTVFIIGAGALVVCLDKEIGLDTVKGIAALKAELTPQIMKVVFKDAGFADDVVKTNTVQILKQAGVDDVKSL
jgi:adenine-specific DNA-methyltransferase